MVIWLVALRRGVVRITRETVAMYDADARAVGRSIGALLCWLKRKIGKTRLKSIFLVTVKCIYTCPITESICSMYSSLRYRLTFRASNGASFLCWGGKRTISMSCTRRRVSHSPDKMPSCVCVCVCMCFLYVHCNYTRVCSCVRVLREG